MKALSRLCFASGVLSILGSMALWSKPGKKTGEPQNMAHSERLAIFMGLWPPTFFILSNLLNQQRRQPTRQQGTLTLEPESATKQFKAKRELQPT